MEKISYAAISELKFNGKEFPKSYKLTSLEGQLSRIYAIRYGDLSTWQYSGYI
jgi:hypothetical protein